MNLTPMIPKIKMHIYIQLQGTFSHQVKRLPTLWPTFHPQKKRQTFHVAKHYKGKNLKCYKPCKNNRIYN